MFKYNLTFCKCVDAYCCEANCDEYVIYLSKVLTRVFDW